MREEHSARYWIDKLGLQAHPEGGFFKETYRCADTLQKEGLPDRYDGERSFSTAIFFLLEGTQFSAFHRLKSDEIWHFHTGAPLIVYSFDKQGSLKASNLGDPGQDDPTFQLVIPAGDWFAARCRDRNSFSLVGCTVAPGFDFNDFELAKRQALIDRFPQHEAIIADLTRE